MVNYSTNLNSIEISQNTSLPRVPGREEDTLGKGDFAYLVNITKLPSRNYVFQRYLLSEIAGELFPNSRFSRCRKFIIPGKNGVAVIYSPRHKRASFGNLIVCGSVWMCAVCAAKISELRRIELVEGVNNHSGGLALLTFTLRHKKFDSLARTAGVLDQAFKKLFEGHWWVEFVARWNYLGKVTAQEITYGVHGWHPHKHCLLFLEQKITKFEAQKMQIELTQHYLFLLEKAGGSALSGLAVDVKVAEKNSDIVAEYLAKFDKLPESPYWGIESELTKSFVKKSKGLKGFTFWELIIKASLGEKEFIDLVREYEKFTHGKTSLKYSRGLKKRLLLQDKSDQDISEQLEKDGIELALLSHHVWRQVKQKNLRSQLLDAAGSGCQEDLEQFMRENQITK